jgi:Calcineurin-like phosphoesterase/Purple acid Phosphatase, N-terminal domain
VRRGLVVVLVVLAIVGGVGWLFLRPKSANTLSGACSKLGQAFGDQGQRTRDEIARAASRAAGATKNDTRLRTFADAVARLTEPPAAGAGAVGRPEDLALINSTCNQPVVPADDSIVTRVPYLTDVTTHSVLVNYATDRSVADVVVDYGLAGSNCTQKHAAAAKSRTAVVVQERVDYLSSVELDGLAPGTRYCYRLSGPVLDVSTKEVAPTFVTAPAVGDTRPYSFAVFGDWGGGTVDEANILTHIAASPAAFVMTVGDNAYITGNQTDYGDLSGGHVFGPTLWPVLGGRLPTFAAQGNHGFSVYPPMLQNWPEPETVAHSAGAYQRSTYCCISTLSRTYHYADAWYAFDWGPARFYVLDGAWADHTGDYTGDYLGHWNGPVRGCTACGAEIQWLKADLAAHQSTPLKFAFFHYPLYSDASDHLSDKLLDGASRLEGLLARNHIDIVFNGHSHVYERNTPQIAGSPMISYISGGGGVGNGTDRLAAVTRCSSFDAYAVGTNHTSCHAPKPSSDTQVYHYLLVTVAGRNVTVTPTDENGHTFDTHTYRF